MAFTEPPSRALLDRLASGDKSALGALYDRHAGLVKGLALRILADTADAEDVVQEVFLQVWRQADRYDDARGSFEAWLVTIARTRALDRLRRRLARREQTEETAPTPSKMPETEKTLAVREALSVLSADQRRAVELAYYGGLTQSEIAETLDTPLGTIKTRIRSALIRLRAELGLASVS